MKKINPGHALVAGCCLALMLGVGFGVGISVKAAAATRNSSGTYSIPNTFTAGTTISSSSVNSNFSDLGTEMTASLERNGKGGMLASLRGIDGTLAAPAFSWTSETGSGLFRNGASDVRMAISGAAAQQWTASAVLPILPLRAAAGLVSAPSLSFAAETNSGLYRNAANDLRFAVNGVDKTFWSTSGFGLGRSPTAFMLSTSNAAAGDTVAEFGTTFPLYLRTAQPGIGFNVFYNGTNTLYGTTNPGGFLTMDGSGNIDIQTAPSGTSGTAATMTTRFRVTPSGTTFSTGIGGDGSGFKHKRVGGCTTAASQGATCDTTVTWGTTFADANYTVSCSGDVTGGNPITVGVQSKSASAITFRTMAFTAVASSFTTVDCVAVHD